MYATYREKIELMIQTIETLFDASTELRELATEEEKRLWNDFRSTILITAHPLRKLNDGLDDTGRADAKTAFKK